jgi:hypothetical protein
MVPVENQPVALPIHLVRKDEIAENPRSFGALTPDCQQRPAIAGLFGRIYPAFVIVGGLIPRRADIYSGRNICSLPPIRLLLMNTSGTVFYSTFFQIHIHAVGESLGNQSRINRGYNRLCCLIP